MRVLITIKRSPPHRYLIHLFTKSLIEEVRALINSNQNSEAVRFVFKHGILEGQVTEEELSQVNADLLLSERNANWDLMSTGGRASNSD